MSGSLTVNVWSSERAVSPVIISVLGLCVAMLLAAHHALARKDLSKKIDFFDIDARWTLMQRAERVTGAGHTALRLRPNLRLLALGRHPPCIVRPRARIY